MRWLLFSLVWMGAYAGIAGQGLPGSPAPFAAIRAVPATAPPLPTGTADNGAQPLTARCGDYRCEPPEDCHSCAEDCGSCCGNHQCEPPEDCHSCPADCGACH